MQSGGVKVSNGTTTTVLSNRLSTRVWGTVNGYVLYQDNGKLYAWSNAGGAVLLFDAVPGNAMISSGTSATTVFFTNGLHQAVYSVPLQ